MFLTDSWVEQTNKVINTIDDELLITRKIIYENISAINQGCEELDKNTKEDARLREKARIPELRSAMGHLRKQIARLEYSSRVKRTLCGVEVFCLVVVCLTGSPLMIMICALCLLVGVLSLRMTYVSIKKYSELIITTCSNYAVVEANIKVFDYRGLETIDLERTPYSKIKYSREDLRTL